MTLKVDVVQNTSGGPVTLTSQYAAKSWINYLGISGSSIQDSENVSSITDHGTGQYSQNFSSSMSNATYAATMCSHQESAGVGSLGHPSAGSSFMVLLESRRDHEFKIQKCLMETMASLIFSLRLPGSNTRRGNVTNTRIGTDKQDEWNLGTAMSSSET